MKLLFDYLVKKSDDQDYDRRNIAWYNIVMLGLSMLFIFSTLKTLVNALKVLVWQIKENTPNYDVNTDQVIGASILILTCFYILAPWIVFNSEPRIWMLFFAASVIIHVAQFFKPIKYVLYGTGGLVAVTAALSSTAMAYYINLNTFYNTVGKNSEIVWSIIHGSMLIGNLVVFAILQGHESNEIPATKYQLFYYGLLFLASLGFLFNFFLGQPTVKSDEEYTIPWLLILKLIQILMTKDMMLLTITFAYMGFQDTFMNGVYGNIIGFTLAWSEETPLQNTALSGILVGLGTLTAMVLMSACKKCLSFKWHTKIFTLGILLHITSYILILFNLPNDSVHGPTRSEGIGMSRFSIALFCSYLLGFGDYCIHAELYALLIEKFDSHFTPATFLQIFITKLCSSIAYFYTATSLFVVVGILLGMSVVGTISFGVVEHFIKKANADELDMPRTTRVTQNQ